MEILRLLFSSGGFMPHGYCFLWNPGLVWLHAISDLLIALAYIAIPLTLIYFTRRRKDLPFNWMFVCFGVFIVACGLTHAVAVWNLWHADYWLSGGIKAITALASLPTAVLLVQMVPRALALPSPEDLRREVRERLTAEEGLRRAHDELEMRVAERTAELGRVNRNLREEIAEREHTKEALRISQERLELAQKTGKIGVFDWDIPSDTIVWTGDLQQMYTPPSGECATDYESWKNFVHPDDRSRVEAAIARAIAKRAALNEEFRVSSPNGEVLWINAKSTLFEGNDGLPSRMVGVHMDVTERRRLEEQLAQSQKMEAVGRLAGGVAHDFNNLLTVIGGYSTMLLEQGSWENGVRESLEEIKAASDRATNLTSQLLAFSRRQIWTPRVLPLNSIVANLDKMLRRLIGEDIDLMTSLGESAGRVNIDSAQLEQVIINLAINARDAMPGGGKLIIETANVDLDETYAHMHLAVKPGAYVRLAVSDTGIGMDASTRSQIFEPFFTTKPKGHGTGLGLSTAYGIVKQAGGNIWVYSEPGKGTSFKIYLPRVDQPEEPSHPEAAAGRSLKGTETILLVEDEDAVRLLLREALEPYGYTILEAGHGEQALSLLSEHPSPIHLLLTDVVMPGMSGRQLADRLVSLRSKTRVLYMSGYTDDAIVHHGVLEPGLAFLQKPFTPRQLARKIREVLDSGNTQRD